MNSQQSDTIEEYENEVRRRGGNPVRDWKESNSPESPGVLFQDVDGVTLMIYKDGLISIPARCSWSFDKYTHVTAAACAKELWARQKALDDTRPKKAQERQGGHLGPIVGHNLRCGQERNPRCPCQDEDSKDRQKRALGARNGKQDTRKEKFRNYNGCP